MSDSNADDHRKNKQIHTIQFSYLFGVYLYQAFIAQKLLTCIKDMYGKSQLWNIQAEHSWRFCKNV